MTAPIPVRLDPAETRKLDALMEFYGLDRSKAIQHSIGIAYDAMRQQQKEDGNMSESLFDAAVDRMRVFYVCLINDTQAQTWPLSEAIAAILDSSPRDSREDVTLMAAGAIMKRLKHIRSVDVPKGKSGGSPLFWGKQGSIEAQACIAFAEYVYDTFLMDRAKGERAMLRANQGRLLAGFDAAYTHEKREEDRQRIKDFAAERHAITAE